MLKAEQIPPDAMYPAWKAMNAGMTLNDAIAAAINAWPGTSFVHRDWDGQQLMCLPLPKEGA